MMNISRAFSYVKEDKDWITKLLITGLITLIPIVGMLYLTGWYMEISRRAKEADSFLLPEVQFGLFLKLGFKEMVVSFVYMIPYMIVSMFYIFSITLLGSFGDSGNRGAMMIAGGMTFGSVMLMMLIAVITSFFLYPALILLIRSGQIRDAFKFGLVWRMLKEKWVSFLILFGMGLVLSFISSFGVILCFIGIIFTMPYAMAVYGYLTGLVMREVSHIE